MLEENIILQTCGFIHSIYFYFNTKRCLLFLANLTNFKCCDQVKKVGYVRDFVISPRCTEPVLNRAPQTEVRTEPRVCTVTPVVLKTATFLS